MMLTIFFPKIKTLKMLTTKNFQILAGLIEINFFKIISGSLSTKDISTLMLLNI